MYNVSDGFKQAIKESSRTIRAKIEINGITYDEEHIISLTYDDTSNPSSQFEIGTTSSATIELSLMNVDEVFETSVIHPYFGLVVNGSIEYVPLGKFYADKVERKKNVVNLTLYDGMIKLEQAYFSDLTYPATITDVINEVATKTGITFEGVLPNYQINKKPEGYTYREIVGLIASMCGGFAKFNREGKLTIKSYANTSETITSDNYIDYNKKKDTVYRIDKISVQAEEDVLTAGSLSAGGSEISFENPFMTQDVLDDIFSSLGGFEYLPTYVKMQGNPALECGDIVTLITVDNEIINIPIMKHKLSYQGGLIGEIESEGESENQNQFSSSGTLSKNVEKVIYEQAQINEALINKANITDLNAVNARIDNIYTNDLSAIYADIDNLEVEVGEIDELLAGNLTAENMQVGAITAGSGVIAEGAIGDAEISNVNAGKVNAGILNTALVTVQGENGRLRFNNNKIQVFENSDIDGTIFERVVLGDVNGDGSVYGLRVRGADGQTILLDENGVTNEGITDGAITDEKVADNANISGTKLDISSVVTEINGSTTKIEGSSILLNNETLDVQFNSLEDTVTEQGETISQQSTQIQTLTNEVSIRVRQQDYETDKENIENRLTVNEASIQTLTDEISLKANATDVYTKSQIDGQFRTVNQQISQLDAELSVQADQIATKVSRTEFESSIAGFEGRNLVITYNQLIDYWINTSGNVEICNSKYYNALMNDYIPVTPGEELTFSKTDSQALDGGYWRWAWYDSNKEYISRKSDNRNVFKWTVPMNVYYIRVSYPYDSKPKIERGPHATPWSPAPEDTQSQIDGLGTRVSSAETSITQLSDQIALKANQSTVDTLANRISSAEITIDGLESEILLKADSTTVSNLESRVSSAELEIDGLNSEINLKVSRDDVISSINLSSESVKIQSSKIDLIGAVTVLSDITGNLGTITAGTISGVTIQGSTIKGTGSTRVEILNDTVKFYRDSSYMGQVTTTDMYGTGEKMLHLIGTNSVYSVGGIAPETSSLGSGSSVYIGKNNAYMFSREKTNSSNSQSQITISPTEINLDFASGSSWVNFVMGSSASGGAARITAAGEIQLNSNLITFPSNVALRSLSDGWYLYNNYGIGGNSYVKFKDDGAFFIVVNGTVRHSFYASGTKSGGSILIDGKNLGMSPIDSPQILIETVEFDIPLTLEGTKVLLDSRFVKTVNNKFAVFPNNGRVIEKGDDYFVIVGEGYADCRIVGERVGYEGVYFDDLHLEN